MGLAEYLLHNRCDLNAFGARDTLRDTLRCTLGKRMYCRLGCIAVVEGAHTVTARTLVGLVGAIAEYLLHNWCGLNAFGARDTLRDTL